ncbi:MAG: Tryptophan--tRNA ligase [Parcubacteria group bacterium Gr01-1014_3]|nr:MAG: Tryptophan--tRNA ligase [Parcubacteria group bacterium Gr01-1014_3]
MSVKPVLISGIQPTGRLHLGNYLGALKNFVELQNSGKYQCYFFIADLHALTENPAAEDLRKNIYSLAADFLAVGLDPKKSIIFQQSQIKFLQDLKWILSTLTPVSELLRMTAFKEKVLQALKPSEREKITKEKFDEIVEQTNFGLIEYPVLMAADILMYDGQLVPVGNDQLQHLEFARTLVRKFNRKFGQTFIEPKALMTSTPRLMSLDDPSKKMSKSRPTGCLFIDDESKTIEEKIKSAVTDSGSEVRYDEKEKPGISNLLVIMSGLSGQPITAIEKEFAGANYGKFKQSLANLVSDHFAIFRKKKAALLQKPAGIKKIIDAGSKKAAKVAAKKIIEIKEKLGLQKI